MVYMDGWVRTRLAGAGVCGHGCCRCGEAGLQATRELSLATGRVRVSRQTRFDALKRSVDEKIANKNNDRRYELYRRSNVGQCEKWRSLD